jgi:hypothetical protein
LAPIYSGLNLNISRASTMWLLVPATCKVGSFGNLSGGFRILKFPKGVYA